MLQTQLKVSAWNPRWTGIPTWEGGYSCYFEQELQHERMFFISFLFFMSRNFFWAGTPTWENVFFYHFNFLWAGTPRREDGGRFGGEENKPCLSSLIRGNLETFWHVAWNLFLSSKHSSQDRRPVRVHNPTSQPRSERRPGAAALDEFL